METYKLPQLAEEHRQNMCPVSTDSEGFYKGFSQAKILMMIRIS